MRWWEKGDRGLCHLAAGHLLTSLIPLALVLRPYLHLLQWQSYSHPIFLSPGGVPWGWGSSHTTLRAECSPEEAVWGPICHTPDRGCPLSPLPPRSLIYETKDDSSAPRFCRMVWPSRGSDQEHPSQVSRLFLPLPPTSPFILPLHYFPHPPVCTRHFCGKYV